MEIDRKLPLCIHGGMPKTGTTTLQGQVYKNLPCLASIGKSYVKNARGKAWKHQLQRLSSDPSWDEADRSAAIRALEESIRERADDYWENRTSIVLSFEGIVNTKGMLSPVERTARLIDLLRDAGFEGDFHFLLTTREPSSFMESQYRNHFNGAHRIPAMVDWVEDRYERWDLFDYGAMKQALGALEGLSSVTFVAMDELFRCETTAVDAVCDALSLDLASRDRFVSLLSNAPREKKRPDEFRFLCGRLRFELARHRIPLGWLVSLLELAASAAIGDSTSESPNRSPAKQAKTQSKIWRDLSGYDSDGLRRPRDP